MSKTQDPLEDLHSIVKKLDSLLKDDEKGLMAWNCCLIDRLEDLKEWMRKTGVLK